MMEVAHRFGISVYFDNIMNHRAFDVPGYNENTPIDTYPGMVPEDFHLKKTEDGFYRKWDNCRDWGSAWQVQNLGLADLIDIAHETPNANFGTTEGSTHPKLSLIRDLARPEQYDKDKDGNTAYFGVLIDQARLELGNSADSTQLTAKAREYINARKEAFTEDVGAYLIRAARWKMIEPRRTACDWMPSNTCPTTFSVSNQVRIRTPAVRVTSAVSSGSLIGLAVLGPITRCFLVTIRM
jgi:hypothetical protein